MRGISTLETKAKLSDLSKLIPFLKRYQLLIWAGCFAVMISSIIGLGVGQGIRVIVDANFSGVSNSTVSINASLGLALVFIIFWCISSFFADYMIKLAAMKIRDDIRISVFENIIHSEAAIIERYKSGEIQTRLISDTEELGAYVALLIPNIFSSIIIFLGALTALFYINFNLTLIIVLSLPIIFSPFLILSGTLRRRGMQTQTALADVGRMTGEVVRRIKVMQAYMQENFEVLMFKKSVREVFDYSRSTLILRSGVNTIIMALALFGISLLLWVSAKHVLSGQSTLGELLAFAFYANMIVRAVGIFVSVVSSSHVMAGMANKIFDILSSEKTSTKKMSSIAKSNESETIVRFDNVDFRYPSRPEIAVLTGIKFSIKKGEKVAIVGPTGAGKSTIFDLLLGFYAPNSGSIFVDNIDIEECPLSVLRSKISIVTQEAALLSGSILENIRYGMAEANESDCEAAARIAHIHDFITSLPKGYETDLGEVGKELSGGQKQQIALARAILSNPSVLLLDEPTSALDSKSEEDISKSINEIRRDRTVLIITHQLKSISDADKIILVENGEIAAIGSHKEILSNNELYRKMCEIQAGYSVDDQQQDKRSIELVTE